MQKILVLRFRRIGDIVLTTPAVQLLKKHFPDARLVYLVEEPYRRLVEGNPDIDQVLAVPPKQTRRAFVRLLGAVRKERFDALLDMHGGPRAAWITLTSRAGKKIGHGIKHKSFLYHATVPRKGAEGPIHSVETHAGLIRALGVEFGKEDIPPLSLPPARPDEVAMVEAIIAAAGAGKLVVLHIGAGNEFRDWGEENLAALVGKLLAMDGINIALVGGVGDQPREEEIIRQLESLVKSPLTPLYEGGDPSDPPENEKSPLTPLYEGGDLSDPPENGKSPLPPFGKDLLQTAGERQAVREVALMPPVAEGGPGLGEHLLRRFHEDGGNRRDWCPGVRGEKGDLRNRPSSPSPGIRRGSFNKWGEIIPLSGRLNLIELRELIARAALFVGPDSGPMHLAASTETPIVALFAPTLPAHFGPWRPGADPGKTVFLQKDLACRPCRQRECITADFRCLRSITPDDVIAACRPFLA